MFEKMRRLYAVGDANQTRTFCVRINSRPEDAAAAAAAEGKSEADIANELRQHRNKVTDLWSAGSSGGGESGGGGGGGGGGAAAQGIKRVLGTRLSEDDVKGLRNFPFEFAQSGLFPALEQFVATLNAVIEKEKKGLTNKLKNWWKKPKVRDVVVP